MRILRGKRRLRVLGMTLVGIMSIAWGSSTACEAASGLQTYFHPDDRLTLRQREWRVTTRTQVNVNQAGLAELQALPGVNLDLALKLARLRAEAPIRDFKDLTARLAALEPSWRARVLDALRDRAAF